MTKRERTPIAEEIREAHESLVSIFADFGIRLDYSLESLATIENYLAKNYPISQGAGSAWPAVRAGVKIYYIGAYLGEALLRRQGGAWHFDEKDPLGQIRAEIRMKSGKNFRPIETVMERIEDGRPLELAALAMEFA